MKNPHGVEPTRFMKEEESKYTIFCDFYCGPNFIDISISNYNKKEDKCFIRNTGKGSYECHPGYKSLLFVNSSGPNEKNEFTLLDYEVFSIDYENRENINKLCNHSDIIWEYITTNDISEESLKQVDDDVELLSDLDAIHCKNSNIRLKISKCCLTNPSEVLPQTQIISHQYDNILREWVGDYKWKLLYRASEHGYTAESFHKCCDGKKPTLIVIKSCRGWIFGGYTTQSWRGQGIYDMI